MKRRGRSTAAERARAVALRNEGWSFHRIGKEIGRPRSTVETWFYKPERSDKPKSKVAWDPFDKCWRIYVRDPDRDIDNHAFVGWWPIKWLRFAHCRVAEEHLERYAEKLGV